MKREDIEKAAGDYSGSNLGFRNDYYVMGKHKAFIAGAEWRINSIWHDCNDRSISINNNEEVVLLLENGKIVEYEDNWEEYYCLVLKWAYKKDLLPNMEE